MELAPGFFVSKLSTEEWEADPETGGEVHVLCSADGVEPGLSRFPASFEGPARYSPPERETLLVLLGSARLEIAGGPTLELKEGDMASLPKGADVTWHLTTPYEEMWVIG